MKISRHGAAIVLLGLVFSNMSCVSGPNAMGRKSFRLLPDKILNEQAATVYVQEKKKNKVTKNAQYNAVVKRVGQRIIAIAERDYQKYCKGFKWEINVFEKPKVVNAYAMPGGKIAFYTGILPICKNEAGVAAVMGHEVSHALLRHGNERVTRQLMVQGLLIGTAIGVGNSQMKDETKRLIMAMSGIGATVGLILPFSRKHEREADIMGLYLMAKAGYDPSEAPEVWRRMAAMSNGKAPPAFLSTHPSHKRRIAELTAHLPEANAMYAKAKNKYGKGETLKFKK